MKKKITVFCILGTLAFGTCTVSAADGTQDISAAFLDIKIVVDGKELATDAEPFIYNGVTYLPVRAVGEAVGKDVLWRDRTNTIVLKTAPPVIPEGSASEEIPEFTLSVTSSGEKERTEILRIASKNTDTKSYAYSLYYYGLSDVSITIDGQTLPLAQALEDGKITLKDILHKAEQDRIDEKIVSHVPRCGGSMWYEYDEYALIKYDGTGEEKRDFYILSPEMSRPALNKQYEYLKYDSLEAVIDFYSSEASSRVTIQDWEDVYKRGVAILSNVAKRDEIPEDELAKAIQQLAKACHIS